MAVDLNSRHQVTMTKVIAIGKKGYGVYFEYDDGTSQFIDDPPMPKDTAEFYATEQLGEHLVIGVHPLLLNAEKADELRQREDKRQRRQEK
jgi:hypothetical protein